MSIANTSINALLRAAEITASMERMPGQPPPDLLPTVRLLGKEIARLRALLEKTKKPKAAGAKKGRRGFRGLTLRQLEVMAAVKGGGSLSEIAQRISAHRSGGLYNTLLRLAKNGFVTLTPRRELTSKGIRALATTDGLPQKLESAATR